MKFSTRGRYALRVMIDLAIHDNGNYIALKDISERQGLTIKYLEQIVSTLNKSCLLKSMRGNNGGHKLARRPDKYTAGDILRSVEGDLTPIECISGVNAEVECPLADDCCTVNFWKGLDRAINSYCDSVTLQDLVDDFTANKVNDFSI